MRRHTQHSLRGGRFAVLYDLADSRTLAAARSVNVESELVVLNEILSHRDFMDEGREFDMDLITTLMAGLVVAYDVQMEDWSNKLDDLLVELRQAVASLLPDGSNQTSGSSNTTVEVGPPPRGPPRKSQRKEIRAEIDDISEVQLVAALIADTQPMDVNLLEEEDPPVPVPQDQSFGNETPEQALAMFMRDRLFIDATVELPHKVPSVVISDTTGLNKLTALMTTGNTTAEIVPEPEPVYTVPMLEETKQGNEVLEKPIELAERGQEVIQPLDVPLPGVSASIADVVNPQQDIIVVGVDDEPHGPVRRWERRRLPPRLDVFLPAPHLRYSVQTEEQILMLIDAHERFVLEKLLNPVLTPERRVRKARIPDIVQPPEEFPLMEPDRSGIIMPQVDPVPTVEITQDGVEQETLLHIQPDPHFEEPRALDESAKATADLSPLQAKLEAILGQKLVELAEKATVNLSDFMLQLMKGHMTYCQLLPPEANYRDVVLAGFHLIIGMEEKGLLHLDQENTLNCGKISIILEERPERNAALELLREAFHAV